MREIILLKTKKNIIKKNISIIYNFYSDNVRIDNINMIKNNNDIIFLTNHYDDNYNLNIICTEYSINETLNNNNNITDLYIYNEKNNTLNLKTYTSNDTITLTDILYIDNNKYMLGRYHQTSSLINIDGQYLDIESGFTSILCKSDINSNLLWYRKIKHTSESDITTGPIIYNMINDQHSYIYTFGLLTNKKESTDVTNLEINEISNPIINKTANEKILIITKLTDKDVIWRKLIKGTNNSLFLKYRIKHNIENKKDFIIISFNFSDNINIDNNVYNTKSKDFINSIIAKIDTNGNFIWIKHIKSKRYTSIIDYTIDDDYIYCLGEFKENIKLDNNYIFHNNLENGYIIKIRKYDGLILNIINIESDKKLILNSITNDNKNIYVSGTWSGNIYFNGKIKNSINNDFFITNIKKNEI